MGFEIIKAEIRLDNMIVWMKGVQNKITDFLVGGKTRTKFEAICVEMERQDFATEQLVRKAIPLSTYQTFNFQLLPARSAYGTVTFTASPTPTAEITIPKGTKLTTSTGTSYETTEEIVVQIGQTSINASVVCTVAGIKGNVASGSVTTITSPITGITAVTNNTAITGGTDIETEADRRARFNQYITTLAMTTAKGVAYGAMTAKLVNGTGDITESVVSVRVMEPPTSGSAGTFSVYIYNGSTGASNDLKAECQKIIDGYYDETGKPVAGYKAAGVVATVIAATPVATVCSMSISAKIGYDTALIKSRAIASIEEYFASLGVGDTLIRNELIQRIMNIDGVYNLTMPFPDIDVEIATYEVVTLDVVQPLTSRVTVSTWGG